MKVTLRLAASSLVLLLSLSYATNGQKKRQTANPQPKTTTSPTPPPTFDTLLPADTFTLYFEVRGAGRVIRSNAVNELLEPILKIAEPAQGFKTAVSWLNAHSDEVMSSRLLVAAWPTDSTKGAPSMLLAVEFPSAEEATKFAASLDQFLPKVIPAPAPTPPTNPTPASDNPARKPAPGSSRAANYYLQRLGSLVVVTPTPWSLKKLKPEGSKLLAEDVAFRTARTRFNTEPLFVFIDFKTIERQEEERRKENAEQRKRFEAEMEKNKQAEAEATVPEAEIVEVTRSPTTENMPADLPGEPAEEPPAPEPMSAALSALSLSMINLQSTWPEGLGLGVSFEGDSIDLRALLINQIGKEQTAIPFLPILITGTPLNPEAPGILPADSELFIAMSLDFAQIHQTLSLLEPPPAFGRSSSKPEMIIRPSPLSQLEQVLKINLKEELIPLLGSEIALSLPLKDMNFFGVSISTPPGTRTQVDEKGEESIASPVVAIAIKDREGMQALLPKLIENLGLKGAKLLAQTERREDTELVSFANVFAYAFVGDFLVLSDNPAGVRHVVDSYLKHETLSADTQFRNSTRWQPRPLLGEAYVSSSLMELYKVWAEQQGSRGTDVVRAFLTRATLTPFPVSYSLSNDGMGPLHEVHIPRNLALLLVTAMAADTNPPPSLRKERSTIGMMHSIASAEERYKADKGNGLYGSLEQLIAEEMVSKEMLESSGYRFELITSGDKFELQAVPLDYGKGGKLSFFIDQTHILRGADRNGGAANASDPPVSW